MKPILLILDDWEGRIAASTCWNKLREQVEIRFLPMHAYHINQNFAHTQGIAIALGRRAKAPLLSVPELCIAMMLGIVHRLPQAQQAMRTGQWPLLTGRTLNGRRLGILGVGRHGSRVAYIAKTGFNIPAWRTASFRTISSHNITR